MRNSVQLALLNRGRQTRKLKPLLRDLAYLVEEVALLPRTTHPSLHDTHLRALPPCTMTRLC
jgi:hypothetical protein